MKKIHVLSYSDSESSLFNYYKQYVKYIDCATMTIKSMQIRAGQQMGELTDSEEWTNSEIITLSEEVVQEVLEKKAVEDKIALYKTRKQRAVEQNEFLKTFPLPNSSIEVIKGRKYKGKKGVVIRYCNDNYPTATGNYLDRSYSAGLGARGRNILDFIDSINTAFISEELKAIKGKSLMCKDLEGNVFFVKPKYVTSLTDNSKSKEEVEAFATKGFKDADISLLWCTKS